MNYFEQSAKQIDSLSFDIMGQAPRFMAMLNGFVLQGNEVANLPRLTALYMLEDKVTLAQPDAEILPAVK